MSQESSLGRMDKNPSTGPSSDPQAISFIDQTLKDLDNIDPWNGLSEFDKELIQWSDSQFFGQTEFQNKFFVVNSQVTPWRQMRQAIMEIQTRLNALQKVTVQYKRTLNDIKRCEYEREQEENEFYKQDKVYEIEILQLDVQVWRNKMRQSKEEINGLLKIIKEKTGGEVELDKLKHTIVDKDIEREEEHKYWIARMAKQSAMDLLTTGRIQAGNLDSMLMMNPADQAAIADLALTYSTAMNTSLNKLKGAAEEKVDKMLENRPPAMFDTAGVLTDYAENNITDRIEAEKSLQSTDKSETNS